MPCIGGPGGMPGYGAGNDVECGAGGACPCCGGGIACGGICPEFLEAAGGADRVAAGCPGFVLLTRRTGCPSGCKGLPVGVRLSPAPGMGIAPLGRRGAPGVGCAITARACSRAR